MSSLTESGHVSSGSAPRKPQSDPQGALIALAGAGEKPPANQSLLGRMRRLRQDPLLRDVVADVTVRPESLILPIFVSDFEQSRPVPSMPAVSQLSVQDAVAGITDLAGCGLKQFMLFGVTAADNKDPTGTYAACPDAPVNRVLSEIRGVGLDVVLYADLCFCEYTDHGHCGVLCAGDSGWVVDNDRTVEQLATTAVAQAQAGADVVAPSAMMDGQVGAIRYALDEADFTGVCILAYSVKYASDLYGPFREASGSVMKFGDRRAYQMDYRCSREWRSELELDIAEGADMVMVKPAVTYLDVVYQVRQACRVPVAAYHVSGEYAMLHAAAQMGWLDLKSAALEQTFAIKRAGADLIVTYFAPQLLEWL